MALVEAARTRLCGDHLDRPFRDPRRDTGAGLRGSARKATPSHRLSPFRVRQERRLGWAPAP